MGIVGEYNVESAPIAFVDFHLLFQLQLCVSTNELHMNILKVATTR